MVVFCFAVFIMESRKIQRSPRNSPRFSSFEKIQKKFRRVITGDETRRVRDTVPSILAENAKVVRSKWRKAVTGVEDKRIRDLIIEKESEPVYVRLFDKFAFTFGVLIILLCEYFLISLPTHFWLWYTLVLTLALSTRVYHFYSLSWQYFLFDFCYFGILCTYLQIFVFPTSPDFFRLVFILANGPLTMAIVVWRNSFVFHDYDRVTSVYIHLLPSMVTYAGRWFGHASLLSNSPPLCLNSEGIGFGGRFLLPRDFIFAALAYILWQAMYYIKTEVVDKKKLDSCPNLVTSLRWISADTKNSLARIILGWCRSLGIFRPDEDYDSRTVKTKLVFITSQFLYTLVTFIPTPLLFWSKGAHLFYIFFIFSVSVFNGASFYIEVFSKNYQSQFMDAVSTSNLVSSSGASTSSKKSISGKSSRGKSMQLSRSNDQLGVSNGFSNSTNCRNSDKRNDLCIQKVRDELITETIKDEVEDNELIIPSNIDVEENDYIDIDQ